MRQPGLGNWNAGSRLIILVVIAGNLLLGLRGLWQQDVNFFTMHPFSDPYVRCAVDTENADVPAFPERLYGRFDENGYEGRLYLEMLPIYGDGIERSLETRGIKRSVTIDCESLHPPIRHFRSQT